MGGLALLLITSNSFGQAPPNITFSYTDGPREINTGGGNFPSGQITASAAITFPNSCTISRVDAFVMSAGGGIIRNAPASVNTNPPVAPNNALVFYQLPDPNLSPNRLPNGKYDVWCIVRIIYTPPSGVAVPLSWLVPVTRNLTIAKGVGVPVTPWGTLGNNGVSTPPGGVLQCDGTWAIASATANRVYGPMGGGPPEAIQVYVYPAGGGYALGVFAATYTPFDPPAPAARPRNGTWAVNTPGIGAGPYITLAAMALVDAGQNPSAQLIGSAWK